MSERDEYLHAQDNYMDALDACEQIARAKAFRNMDVDATAAELMALDRRLLRAKADVEVKREAWIRAREARYAEG